MISILFILVSFQAGAQLIASDCTPAEIKALHAQGIINQFVLQGRLQTQDCVPAQASDREMLLVAQVFNSPSGYECYVSTFERKGFGEKSVAVYKSPMIGFDLFPILSNKNHRLIYVHPSSDKTKLVVYLNVQSGPTATRFGRWEYNYDKKDLVEVPNRFWVLEAGVLPKVYDDRGSLRALLESRSVEL